MVSTAMFRHTERAGINVSTLNRFADRPSTISDVFPVTQLPPFFWDSGVAAQHRIPSFYVARTVRFGVKLYHDQCYAQFLIYLSIYFYLTCFRLSFGPYSEAGVQFRQWFMSPG
jgi:hypothetical protein